MTNEECRFWNHVRIGDGCWDWIGSVAGGGYGKFQFKGVISVATRVIWTIHKGAIPDGIYVCHRCDNRACVRLSHLFLGTHADNMADRDRKGRGKFVTRVGSTSPTAKLVESDALEIRRRRSAGESASDLAREFGISRSLVWHIAARRAWRHV